MDVVGEQVFCASSALVTAYIQCARFSEDEYTYYAMAFQGLDDILDAFGLEVAEKVELLGHMYASFFKEFGETKELKVQLASKYREIQQTSGSPSRSRQYRIPLPSVKSEVSKVNLMKPWLMWRSKPDLTH